MGINIEILALVFGSAILCVLAGAAAIVGISVLAGWNPADSSSRQLARERRSILVETITKVVLAFQLVSLVAFVAVIDRLHPLFPGAMCAVGTLNAHPLGYPALLTKVVVFVLCALWLILNRATPAASSTGLVRLKYGALVPVAGALAVENVLQLRYFSGLKPDIITSCCATVFDQNGQGIGSELAALPVRGTRVAFFVFLSLTLVAGLHVLRRGRSPVAFSLLSLVLAVVSIAAVLSWMAPSIYELPTHHCPLCLLASGHRPVGYLLYLSLALGAVTGGGSGLVHLLRRFDPVRSIRAGEERRLCIASMTGFALFGAVGVWPMLTSALRMGGS